MEEKKKYRSLGITGDNQEYYNNNYDQYETILTEGKYQGARICARLVQKYVGDNKGIRLIDVAAGTGFVGEELSKLGYNNIDALEPSEQMAGVAKEKLVYQRFVHELLSETPTSIENDYYDCLVSSGGFLKGHIPCCGLLEMIRIIRPEGLIILVLGKRYFTQVPEYNNRLEPLMLELEEQGMWEKMESDFHEDYCVQFPGVSYVYRVKKSDLAKFKSAVL